MKSRRSTAALRALRLLLACQEHRIGVRKGDGKWSKRDAANVRNQSIVALHLESLKQFDIAKEVGTSLGTVNWVISAL